MGSSWARKARSFCSAIASHITPASHTAHTTCPVYPAYPPSALPSTLGLTLTAPNAQSKLTTWCGRKCPGDFSTCIKPTTHTHTHM